MTQDEIAYAWDNAHVKPVQYSFWKGKELPDGSMLARIDDDFRNQYECRPLPQQWYILPPEELKVETDTSANCKEGQHHLCSGGQRGEQGVDGTDLDGGGWSCDCICHHPQFSPEMLAEQFTQELNRLHMLIHDAMKTDVGDRIAHGSPLEWLTAIDSLRMSADKLEKVKNG